MRRSKVKDRVAEVFKQKSFGAEPEPPVEIEYYNGAIILSQSGHGFISISPESLDEFFAEIKRVVNE